MDTINLTMLITILVIIISILVFVCIDYFSNKSSSSSSSSTSTPPPTTTTTPPTPPPTNTTPSVPGVVTGVNISNITSVGCVVTWDPTPTATSYQWIIISSKAVGANGTTVGTKIYVTSLDADFTYNLTIQAVNAAGMVGPIGTTYQFITLPVQSSNQ